MVLCLLTCTPLKVLSLLYVAVLPVAPTPKTSSPHVSDWLNVFRGVGLSCVDPNVGQRIYGPLHAGLRTGCSVHSNYFTLRSLRSRIQIQGNGTQDI